MAINQKPIALNSRPCPLPEISWGNRTTFWQMICNRDSATLTYRNPDYQECHEHITSRMRAILLDWLIEVLFQQDKSIYNVLNVIILCVCIILGGICL